jgi:hypothetical protein
MSFQSALMEEEWAPLLAGPLELEGVRSVGAVIYKTDIVSWHGAERPGSISANLM